MSKNAQPAPRGVALGGFMGVGKTTTGLRIARRLGLEFVDTDAVLAARHGPLDALIRERGEAAFRALERGVIAEIAASPAGVVATGGGAWVDPHNRDLLRAAHDLVVLTAPLDVLAGRVAGGAGRPLWDGAVAARYAARASAYADADLVIDTSTSDPDAVVDTIVAWREARCSG